MISSNKIRITRDSFNMGDDRFAPHLIEKDYNPNQTLLSFCKSLKSYVANIGNCVWIIKSKEEILGYIYYNKIGMNKVELAENNVKMSDRKIDEVHCKYIPATYFLKAKNGTSMILSDPNTYSIEYPECRTLIEKVRKHFGGK